MSTSALSLFAQRARLVAASAATWCRIIKERGWIRPRKRIHPPKPKIGVRAFAPNIYWHIDTTVIRLLDGRKLYLHAGIAVVLGIYLLRLERRRRTRRVK